jgi:exopolysaccharide biosynthesis WecB/TagA/CpsF family protein
VVWAAGGVLDYVSGRFRRAPRFMRQLGLEWLGRALIEPRRLGRRYLIGIPRFLWRAVRHAVWPARA